MICFCHTACFYFWMQNHIQFKWQRNTLRSFYQPFSNAGVRKHTWILDTTKMFLYIIKGEDRIFKTTVQEPLLSPYLSLQALLLRIHGRFSMILKISNKSAWSNAFCYIKVYIFSKLIQYTTHWDKTQMWKKFLSEKINVTKMLHLITVLLSIRNSYTSLKLCVRFSIFNSVLFLLKFIFLFNKKLRLFDFKAS